MITSESGYPKCGPGTKRGRQTDFYWHFGLLAELAHVTRDGILTESLIIRHDYNLDSILV